MKKWLGEIELTGKQVRLVPMSKGHRDEIILAASDGKLWDLWTTSVPSESTIDAYINFALEEQSFQRSLPFVVVHAESNQIIGSTRYCNATPAHRRLEIGYTWYSESFQRTGVNTECKYLLLSHAFETLDCIAVEFRTHLHNKPSQKAIERLGAKKDGILRKHLIDARGTFRDSVVYSITSEEWPEVKRGLEQKLKIY
ncbi:MAG: RimJ/RimL family protein N-acetyltransferase [Crocinitomicaceae bacterium]|jgi:RimJ/RimL family protein N-acetyltransferase